jgi:hypothetical protein
MLSLATLSEKFTFECTDSKITGSKFAEKQNYTLIQGIRTSVRVLSTGFLELLLYMETSLIYFSIQSTVITIHLKT